VLDRLVSWIGSRHRVRRRRGSPPVYAVVPAGRGLHS
jgi:hypothetical protein